MSYTIKKSDGTTLAVVPENDIVLDKASVALIGRGSTNYGIKHSEAFVHTIENFANTTPPAHPLEGQIWYDKGPGALKVYKGGQWVLVGAGGGSGGDGGTGGVGGPIYVQIGNTSVLALVAGGKVIAVVSPLNIPNGDLPVSITVLAQTIPFRSRFPVGLEAGFNLASDPEDYIVFGHVPNADAAIWTGGGNPFAATTYVDLGPTSAALTISNNLIVAAYSQSAVANANLPTNFTVNGVTMPFRAAFPSGLRAGLTLASGMGLGIGSTLITGSGDVGGGSLTTEIVAEMISDEAEARATAITNLYAYANSTFATAGQVTTLTASFLSGTGQATLAEAIDWLIVTAGEGTANADAGTLLRSEIRNAITGASSFAHALQLLNTAVTTDYATASDLTSLESGMKNTNNTALSKAVQNLMTLSTGEPKTHVATATTANITLSGVQTINGVSTAAGTRVLVKNQTTASQNGIYVAAAGAWTRATDMDVWAEVGGAFVMVDGGTLAGTAWRCTNTASGTLGTTAITWEKVDINTSLAQFKTELNSEFESVTGYTSIASAVNDLKTIATGTGSVVSQDTDLRTRFTNAMANGETAGSITTIQQAMDKFKDFSTKIKVGTDLMGALRDMTGSGVNDSAATVAQKLVSQSGLTGALSTFKTNLTAEYVSAMNEVTGGTGTTFAAAVTDVIATSTSDGSGSTSSIDTALRNLFINLTHETAFPVQSVTEAIQKLMSNTTKDRALAQQVTQLEGIFTTGLGGTISQAGSNLYALATANSANSQFITDLKSTLTTETGQSTWSAAVDHLATGATTAAATATKMATLESNFLTESGEATFAGAIQKLWTVAEAGSTVAGFGVTLNNNGYVTGIEALNGGPGQSHFKVSADKFIVADPNDSSPTPVFEVVGGAAYIKGERIQPGTVTATKVVSAYPYQNFNTYGLTSLEIVFPAGTVPANAQCFLGVGVSGRKTGSDDDTYYIWVEKYAYRSSTWVEGGGGGGTGVGGGELGGGFEQNEALEFSGSMAHYGSYSGPPGYSWAPLPGQEATVNFISGDGCSNSWTFVDAQINATEATGEIRYRINKRNRNSGVGFVEAITLTAIMGKK